MKCVFLFGSIHHVMKAEKLLKGKGMEADLIPVPREISSDCGVAIELPLGLKEDVLHLFRENKILIFECYTKAEGRAFEKIE